MLYCTNNLALIIFYDQFYFLSIYHRWLLFLLLYDSTQPKVIYQEEEEDSEEEKGWLYRSVQNLQWL